MSLGSLAETFVAYSVHNRYALTDSQGIKAVFLSCSVCVHVMYMSHIPEFYWSAIFPPRPRQLVTIQGL